jgi:hypothetical protein
MSKILLKWAKNQPNHRKYTPKSSNIVLTIPDDSFHHIGSGVESDSLLRGPKKSESHENDFSGIGPALTGRLLLDAFM